MHDHLKKIQKICESFKHGETNHQLNLDILLKFSSIEFMYFDELTEENFEELMRLYYVIGLNYTKESFDDFYFSNQENAGAKIRTILSRIDYKTQELIDGRLYVENLPDEDVKTNSLNRIDDVLFHYYNILRFFMHFVPDLILKSKVLYSYEIESSQTQIEQQKSDPRRSLKAPTNIERIHALKIFCPGLWKQLANSPKEIQKQVIHNISGVNLEDSYKFSFGHRQVDIPTEKLAELTQLASKISTQ